MQIFFDLFPVILFFIAFKMYDIYVATAVAIVASVAQVSIYYLRHKKVENMHLITMVLILLLGGATLILHDETFIKWKPTVVNWLFGLVFLGSHFVGKETIIERLMAAKINLPQEIWSKLNLMWVGFFIFCGALNLLVAFNVPTETWVNFKLFGLTGLTLIFVLLQSLFLSRHADLTDE
jgi:intracellular septation protein